MSYIKNYFEKEISNDTFDAQMRSLQIQQASTIWNNTPIEVRKQRFTICEPTHFEILPSTLQLLIVDVLENKKYI